MDIAILTALILLNGVFAMSEIALVTARKSRLQKLAEDGDQAAASAIRLGEEPTQFLSTVQIGITAIGLLNGIFGEAALADPLATWLQSIGLNEKISSASATAIVVISITYASIVVGELVPKRLAQFNAEGIARLMARPISLLAMVSKPFVFLLSLSTDMILRLLGKKELGSANITEEDIQAVLAEGTQTGVIEKQEHDMVRNVFRFDDRKMVSLMTPRSEIVYLDIEHPIKANLEKLLGSEHSYFPVCKGGFENVQGVISAKQLLQQQLNGKIDDIADSLLAAVYVPENWTGTQLLEMFRASGDPMVFVVDEYGDIQGVVTALDLLEALVGEFNTSDPEDLWSVQNEDGTWLFDGLIPIMVLKDMLELKSIPEEEKGGYHTLSGMMMWLISGLPRIGDSTEWQGWRFEVITLDGNRVDKVLASRKVS
ncbi:hemolysin family protein [Photobacterium sp. SDRW27]|uniref:hemolysin family protein n=1 Tax=Photobacterium obscurum TaxID=2829490 RepID=UPI00224409C0|nr:hemolysin family protein [Photobacterium obscurum]MCW8328908.1 hemolysin family protein [Photobacterium obscurum]